MSSIERRPLRAAAALLLAASLATVLAGCATGGDGPSAQAAKAPPAPTPLDQYPLKAVEAPERLQLAVHADGALSPAQEDALARFAAEWREAGGESPFVIETPVNSQEAGDPVAQAHRVFARLGALGAAPDGVRLASYDAGGAAGAPLVVRYDRLAAATTDCAGRWDNLVATRDNAVSKHFGCAMSNNMAAMIADPRDLVRARAMTPADSGRRAVVLDKYRQGQITSSAKDDQAQGVVSQTSR